MDKILCPDGCGKSFEPERMANGLRRKYATPACKNRMKQRRHRVKVAKEKRELAAQGQRGLKFQPLPRPERRSKSRIPKAPEEESMFA